MAFVSRRSQVFWAFVGLALAFLLLFSAVFYFESDRNWNLQKYQGLSALISDIESVPQAERYFSDIRVVSPYGKIVLNEGIFTVLPQDIKDDDRKVDYQGLSLYVIGKELSDGSKILFVDDITDAVESQKLMFRSLFTSTLILWVLVILIGWIFTRGIFQPVKRIVKAMENFHLEQDPSLDHVPLSGKESDEFVRIARNLEALFARVRTETSKIEDLSSNIAHELKNGLFGIASTLELAMMMEKPQKKIGQVHVQVLQLWEVVQSLLLLANKEMHIETEPTELGSVLAKYRESDPRITIEGPARAKWNIKQDLFDIAMGNIVGNARKFTPENGKITIRYSKNEVVVEDTGAGISPEQLPYVFDRFYKADSMRPNGSGTGLGLTLAKHILEKLHGFRISISSTVGVGTQVTISQKAAAVNDDLTDSE